jgi:hypothetical protein
VSDCRFIDTAGDLEMDGITDPQGKEHLAEVLGHLYELKLVGLPSPHRKSLISSLGAAET